MVFFRGLILVRKEGFKKDENWERVDKKEFKTVPTLSGSLLQFANSPMHGAHKSDFSRGRTPTCWQEDYSHCTKL